jgi:hypothetical protein
MAAYACIRISAFVGTRPPTPLAKNCRTPTIGLSLGTSFRSRAM